jgi:outer membrane lipoprotein SlyB
MNRKEEEMKLQWIVLLVGLTVLLTGCSNLNRTQQGALAGGAVGALAGQGFGGDTKSTLIGTGIGAATGALAGNYMEKKEDQSRQQGYTQGYYQGYGSGQQSIAQSKEPTTNW